MKKISFLAVALLFFLQVYAQGVAIKKVESSKGYGNISGIVIDRYEDPIPFATVELINELEMIYSCQTDFDGNYTMKNIEVGVYRILVSCPGYDSRYSSRIIVSADKTTRENIMLKQPIESSESIGNISGVITDKETGEPIPHSNVVLFSSKEALVTGFQTSFDGKYTLKDITSGTYTMRIYNIGYEKQQITGFVFDANKTEEHNIMLQPIPKEGEEFIIVHPPHIYKDVQIQDNSVSPIDEPSKKPKSKKKDTKNAQRTQVKTP